MDAVKDTFRKCDKASKGKISEDALAKLIQRLCEPRDASEGEGGALKLEVIRAMFSSFDGQHDQGRLIDYNDFIDWLFESLDATGGAASSLSQVLESPPAPLAAERQKSSGVQPAGGIRCTMFCSHQHTNEAVARRADWLAGTEQDSVKASTPPFNVRLNVDLPPKCVSLCIATFGVKLPRVIMKVFEDPALKRLSEEMKIPIPRYSLDSFVQKKMAKVLDLCKEARKPELNLNEKNLAAVAKVEAFCKGFEQLDKEDGMKINGPDKFQEFVLQHVKEGWEEHLHFESVLPENFGFDREVSETLRTRTIKVQEKEGEVDVALEHHSLRWLTKAFKGYGPVGCLTDVVNLVYAMLNLEQPAEASEQAAIDAFYKFQDLLNAGQFDNMWIPSHLVHDAESDDSLCWLLLEHIHRLRRTELKVLIQLPADEKVDDVAAYLRDHTGDRVQVFRDKDSSHGKAVNGTWSKYIVKSMLAGAAKPSS